jgi:DNA modification methylase
MPTVRLMLGDCVDRMAEIEAGSVDLILTSPPYDNLRAYASGSAFDFEGTADQCRRVLKTGGVLVWVVGDQTVDGSETGTSFRQALHFKAIGLRLRDTMIYRKANPFHTGDRSHYQGSFEFMFVLTKGKPRTIHILTTPCHQAGKVYRTSRHREGGGDLKVLDGAARPIRETKARPNVWTYFRRGKGSGHPATFPLQLAVDHILSWTNPGDLVLDPFVGSGTVLEACLKTGRRGIGIDISPDYLALVERRIAPVQAEMPLFPATA